MAGKYPGLWLKGGTYYVRVSVPADCRQKIGKTELIESLKTGDRRDAERFYPEVARRFKKEIATARGQGGVTRTLYRRAMANWMWKNVQDRASGRDLTTPWELTDEIQRLDRISKTGQPDDYEGFDDVILDMLRIGGLETMPNSEALATFRSDAAALRARTLWMRERARLVIAHKEHAASLRGQNLKEAFSALPDPEGGAKVLPAPSLTLRRLFNQWRATKAVNEKEQGRLDHQLRRLIEVVGDKPANHLTKGEVREFMELVARFPGRKRTAELNALPMRDLVEKFEAQNATIAKRNAIKIKEAEAKGIAPVGLEEVPGTLKAATVDEWFGAFRQMFEYAVAMHDFEYNPFEATRKFVAKGAEAQKKREFTPDEIAIIFGAPLFNGFEGDGGRGYRNTPGKTLIRDAKYWLPILALFHGGRLTEFAAMPHADLKQDTAGHWYFDLTKRQVKKRDQPALHSSSPGSRTTWLPRIRRPASPPQFTVAVPGTRSSVKARSRPFFQQMVGKLDDRARTYRQGDHLPFVASYVEASSPPVGSEGRNARRYQWPQRIGCEPFLRAGR